MATVAPMVVVVVPSINGSWRFYHLKWATLCIIVRRSLRTYAPLIRFHRLPLPSRYFEPREDRKITFRLRTRDLAIRWFFFPLVFFQRFRISVRDITIFPLSPLFYSWRWPSGKLDDTASFKDRMFEGICFIRAHSSVFRWNSICSQLGKFSAIPPLYFFPPRWFCFRGGFFWFWFSRLFLSFSFFFYLCAAASNYELQLLAS